MISERRLRQLVDLIANGREHAFYLWGEWKKVSKDVRDLDHNECVMCRAEGHYGRPDIVHHVKHLRDRPDLALSIYDPDTGERQLVTICKNHHEREHPEAFRQNASKKPEPITAERWD